MKAAKSEKTSAKSKPYKAR